MPRRARRRSRWRSSAIGFVEYATRHLLLNPKVIASNQLEDYFRVNSLFFDPNIYGRFLAIVMVLLVGVAAVGAPRTRDVVAAAPLLARAVGRARADALAVELRGAARRPRGPRRRCAGACAGRSRCRRAASWSSRSRSWRSRRARCSSTLGNSKSANKATSGRSDLIKGGVQLFADRPLAGLGLGRRSRASTAATSTSRPSSATSASHTIPITVAAEQGVIGLLVYLALLRRRASLRLFRGARGGPVRAASPPRSSRSCVHTLLYAAFLEDPLTWALLGVGHGAGAAAGRRRASRPQRASRAPA